MRRLNKELKECKSKAASLLQAQIRGYLARLKFKRMTMERSESSSSGDGAKPRMSSTSSGNNKNNSSTAANDNNNNASTTATTTNAARINYEALLKSVKIIQSHWRGYAIRKLYRDLKLDMATKAMQFGYFCEQVG